MHVLWTRIGRVLALCVVLGALGLVTFSESAGNRLRDMFVSTAVRAGSVGDAVPLANMLVTKKELLNENARLTALVASYERTQKELSLEDHSLKSLCSLVNVPLENAYGDSVNAKKILTIDPIQNFGLVVGFDRYIFGTLVVYFSPTETPPQIKDFVIADDGYALGTVRTVGQSSAVVDLFTASGHTLQAKIENSDVVQFVGKGANTLEAHVSQKLKVSLGDTVVLPGTFVPVAVVTEILATPEDATQTIRARPKTNPASHSVVTFVRYEN
ncbi:MAG: rod shape-determining protein MreC [Minisyncoccia bacterium]